MKYKKLKRCQACGRFDGLMVISVSKLASGIKRRYYICKICNTKRIAIYRKTPKGFKKIHKAIEKYKNKLKIINKKI
jgi:protein-arginine kinase activator protein McsA